MICRTNIYRRKGVVYSSNSASDALIWSTQFRFYAFYKIMLSLLCLIERAVEKCLIKTSFTLIFIHKKNKNNRPLKYFTSSLLIIFSKTESLQKEWSLVFSYSVSKKGLEFGFSISTAGIPNTGADVSKLSQICPKLVSILSQTILNLLSPS